jgi:hypothetical protein
VAVRQLLIDWPSPNLPPPDQSLDRRWQLRHRADDGVGSGGGKTSGQLVAGVAGARESYRGHTGSPSGFDAQDGVFDDDAIRWIGTEAARSQKEEIRSGLAVCHLRGAEDIVPEHRREPAHLERERETIGSR